MFKLDRNAHSTGKITDFKREVDHYKDFNLKQIAEGLDIFVEVSAENYNKLKTRFLNSYYPYLI